MIDHGPKNVLGIYIHAVDYEAAVERITRAAQDRQPLAASALAVHGVMTGVLDPVQRYRLNRLDLIVPDGQPVRWALRWLYGVRLPDRVYGPSLMLRVCERFAREGLPIYLYGSQPGTLDSLQSNLQAMFPGLRIAGAVPSRFRRLSVEEKKEAAACIRDSGAALAFVGLGCPRQEVWVYEHRELLAMPLVAVGAAFDFHARLLPQAPRVLQQNGLEWFYRLLQEPRRLWKRYLLLNPVYLALLVLQRTGLRAFDPQQSQAPADEARYG
jgi:exopolysaccharide biosynthesis WecB/TagA/CpsF family protein